MNDLEQVIDRIQRGLLTPGEVKAFYIFFRKYVVQNFEEQKPQIEFLKQMFFEGCRKNYKEFYNMNLKHLDHVYRKKIEIFMLLI